MAYVVASTLALSMSTALGGRAAGFTIFEDLASGHASGRSAGLHAEAMAFAQTNDTVGKAPAQRKALTGFVKHGGARATNASGPPVSQARGLSFTIPEGLPSGHAFGHGAGLHAEAMVFAQADDTLDEELAHDVPVAIHNSVDGSEASYDPVVLKGFAELGLAMQRPYLYQPSLPWEVVQTVFLLFALVSAVAGLVGTLFIAVEVMYEEPTNADDWGPAAQKPPVKIHIV